MELPVINVKKRSRSTDDGAARPRWQRLALLTAVIAATVIAAVSTNAARRRRRRP